MAVERYVGKIVGFEVELEENYVFPDQVRGQSVGTKGEGSPWYLRLTRQRHPCRQTAETSPLP